MAWKRLKVYVTELLMFLCIVAFVSGTYFLTDIITIRFCALSIILLLLIAIWICYYIVSFVPFAFRVIIDLILNDYQTLEGKIIESFIFKSSSTLSKRNTRPTKGRTELTETLYYKIVIETNQGLEILTASEFVFLEKGEIYDFLIGTHSKTLIEARKKRQGKTGGRQGDGSSGRQGDGSSVLAKPEKGDDIPANREISE